MGQNITDKDREDTEVLARLGNYMRFMKGYGQLVLDLAGYTKSSTRSVYRWIKSKTIPDRYKIKLIKAWLDAQEDRENVE